MIGTRGLASRMAEASDTRPDQTTATESDAEGIVSSVLDGLEEAGVVTDEDGQVTRLSDAACSLFETSESAAVGASVTDPYGEQNEASGLMGAVLRTGEPVRGRMETIRLDGPDVHTSRTAFALRDGDGFVVANEIKTFAEEPQDAVDDTEATITTAQEQTGDVADSTERTDRRVSDGVDGVGEGVEPIDSIQDTVDRTSEGITEVSEATETQVENAQEVSHVVEDTTAMSQEIAGSVQEISAAVDQQSAAMDEGVEMSRSSAGSATTCTETSTRSNCEPKPRRTSRRSRLIDTVVRNYLRPSFVFRPFLASRRDGCANTAGTNYARPYERMRRFPARTDTARPAGRPATRRPRRVGSTPKAGLSRSGTESRSH